MIEINSLNKTFYPGTADENILFDNLNVDFESAKSTAIIGPNGCGKSSLLNIISGSLRQDSGEVKVDDLLISEMSEEDRAKFIGKVNQDPSRGVSPSLTVLENMALALKKGERFTLRGLLRNTDKDFIIEKLKGLDLGLENKLNTRVQYLSGGQRQSLSLLMATINNPTLLLLDEHTAALDPKTSRIVMERTRDLIDEEEMTTIMISHNFEEAIDYADRIVMMNKGHVAFEFDTKDLTKEDLNRVYNQVIMESFQ